MNAKQDIADTLSTIEEQINLIPMSQYERDAALHYARVGARFTEVAVWVCNQARRLGETGYAKPNLKY
jgi:hypothetical protein